MTAATQTSDRDQAQAGGNGPGALLRRAREATGMTLRDVSAQMHLDERTLVALEADDFPALPAPTFVRGYLRGYARLLGLPVGPVMEAYDREGFTPPDLVADIADKPQARSGDFPVQLMTYVVVGVLLVLVVLWWNNQSFDDLVPIGDESAAVPAEEPPLTVETPASAVDGEPTPEPTHEPTMAVAPETPPSAPAAPAATPVEETAPAAAAGDTPAAPPDRTPAAATAAGPAVVPAPAPPAIAAAERAIGQAEQVLEESRGAIEAAAARVSDAPTTDDAPAAAAPSPAPAATPAPQAPAPPAAAQPAASVAGAGRLRLRFPEEAWVEIYDRDGKRMFYNLVKPGRELDLSGQPPIRVLLGRTQGVFVEYNGERVDLAPYTERGVARFTIGR